MITFSTPSHDYIRFPIQGFTQVYEKKSEDFTRRSRDYFPAF